jgi:hypothetical protein
LRACCQSYLNRTINLPDAMCKNLHPIDEDTNLYGVDGVSFFEKTDFSTSYGWPFNKKKNLILDRSDKYPEKFPHGTCAIDQRTRRLIDRAEDLLSHGERANFIFNSSFKDELTTEKKMAASKVRIFQCISYPGNYLLRKYFLPLVALVESFHFVFESAVSANCHGPDWDMFAARHITPGWSTFCGDYTNFDQAMSASFTQSAWSILITLGKTRGTYTDTDVQIMSALAAECSRPFLNFFGDFFVIDGSQPSGHGLTVINNGIVNSLYIRYAYYVIFGNLDGFNELVRVLTYGDDNLVTVHNSIRDRFNQVTVSAALATIGVTYTDAFKSAVMDPFVEPHNISFLKRAFVQRDGIWMAPLEKDSIYGALMYHGETSNPLTRDIGVLYSQAREFIQWGREEYEEYISMIPECLTYTNLTDEARIVDCKYVTYEDYLEERRKTKSRMEVMYSDFTYEERHQNFWFDAHQE